MPLLNDLTYTTSRGGVYGNEHDLRGSVRPDWGAKGFLAVGAKVHRDFQIEVPRIRALGSIGASLVYTARGAAAAALLPKVRVWDVVAGAAILERAGGELRYLSGGPIDYQELLDGRRAREPIIAGHPNLLAGLQAAIRPLREFAQVID
jgi:fructose-1,6-bisphosphatase/inositol monophosphatase family enzyme